MSVISQRQRRKRDVLQNTVSNDDESLLFQLSSEWLQQHSTQVCCRFRRARTRCRQKLVETPRLLLNRRASRQLKRLNRIRRDCPHKTLLLTECILEQQRI